jgi:hypothetical protein
MLACVLPRVDTSASSVRITSRRVSVGPGTLRRTRLRAASAVRASVSMVPSPPGRQHAMPLREQPRDPFRGPSIKPSGPEVANHMRYGAASPASFAHAGMPRAVLTESPWPASAGVRRLPCERLGRASRWRAGGPTSLPSRATHRPAPNRGRRSGHEDVRTGGPEPVRAFFAARQPSRTPDAERRSRDEGLLWREPRAARRRACSGGPSSRAVPWTLRAGSSIWTECLTTDQEVGGSSPSRRTRSYQADRLAGGRGGVDVAGGEARRGVHRPDARLVVPGRAESDVRLEGPEPTPGMGRRPGTEGTPPA